VPRLMPIGLTGTHGSPVGAKSNNKIDIYLCVCL
jgi:hypothetical protein